MIGFFVTVIVVCTGIVLFFVIKRKLADNRKRRKEEIEENRRNEQIIKESPEKQIVQEIDPCQCISSEQITTCEEDIQKQSNKDTDQFKHLEPTGLQDASPNKRQKKKKGKKKKKRKLNDDDENSDFKRRIKTAKWLKSKTQIRKSNKVFDENAGKVVIILTSSSTDIPIFNSKNVYHHKKRTNKRKRSKAERLMSRG